MRSLAVALAACVAAWILTCVALEGIARRVEDRFDAHLWRYEEWMQLLSPARYTAGTHERILVIGPSESREAFWPAPFRDVVRDARLVNDSLSLSTFEDAITQLEYIERVYGTGAMGELLVVAVTPRFLQGYAQAERPLPIVLNRYSPHFALDESVEPQVLVEKGPIASALASIRLAGHSGARYTKALRALVFAAQARFDGRDVAEVFKAHSLVASRFFDEVPREKRTYYDLARAGAGYNAPLRSLDLRSRRDAVRRDFQRLRDIAGRNSARILVVNMPEGGWARQHFYESGIHEAYMAVLHEAVGDLPFLDLRDALPDEGFVDWVHPTMDAGLMLSRRVAAEIRKLES